MQENTPGDDKRQLEPKTVSQGSIQTQRARRSLAIALLRAREAVMSHFRPILAAHDVTEQQWRVIRVLYEAGQLDATEVADKASILAPSLTRMIRSLEERGFISKHKDDADGRRVLLQITSSGREIVEDVMPESLKVYADIDARFGAARVDRLLDMLEELASLKMENGSLGEE
ncbi:homoprotocatechuate degradation operon regulator HpaR [Sinorhizobium kostiense]|nr:homoprotocatechuate degradation operon regulator HpaR [Sinorhizobium kostiense]